MTEFELSQLPETKSGKRMFRRVSPIYENSLFIKKYFDALGFDYDIIRKYFETLREQHYIETVDWGIEYMEHRYSVVPDDSLTLEERRARLKIRSMNKYPLNPAILEKIARENFNFYCYLDETHAGYIWVLANNLQRTFDGTFIDWLVVEKPAHLALGISLQKFFYVGSGGDPNFLDPKKFYPEPPLPQTKEEKSRFPHLNVGIAATYLGCKKIGLARPKNQRINLHAGIATAQLGFKTFGLARPKNQRVNLHAGLVTIRAGCITIPCDPADLNRRPYIKESPISDLLVSDAGIARAGSFVQVNYRTEPVTLKVFVNIGHGIIRTGYITIPCADKEIEPEFWATPDGEYLRLLMDFATGRDHPILLANPRDDLTVADVKNLGDFAAQHALLINSKAEGTLGVRRADLISAFPIHSADDMAKLPDSGELRIIWDFPKGDYRHTLVNNLRSGLTVGDIKKLGKQTAADKILLNSRNQAATGIKRVQVTKKFFTRTDSGDTPIRF